MFWPVLSVAVASTLLTHTSVHSTLQVRVELQELSQLNVCNWVTRLGVRSQAEKVICSAIVTHGVR